MKTGFLDGLRALAALLVLVAHCAIWSGSQMLSPVGVPAGYVAKLAVDLFMVLSGCLMAFTVRERSNREPMNQPRSWLNFYLRRFFRIAPAYYLSLICAALFSGAFLSGYSFLADRIPWLAPSIYNARSIEYSGPNLLLHVSFLFGLFPSWAFSTQLPDWSLSLEMQFYAMFPFITLAIARWGAIPVCLALTCPCVAAIHAWWPLYPEPSLLPFKLPVFLSGILLVYAAYDPVRRLWLRALALALPLTQVFFYGWLAIWISVSVGLVIFMAGEFHAPFGRRIQYLFNIALVHWVMRRLATMSYSIYLFHGFAISAIGSFLFRKELFLRLPLQMQVGLLAFAVLVATLVGAAIVERYVERTGINIGRWILCRGMQRRISRASLPASS